MKTFSLFLIGLFFSNTILAFTQGEGSEFIMETEGQKVSLSIYIVKVGQKNMSVEFHFGAGGIFTMNMWQQYQMDVSSADGVKIQKGFMLKDNAEKPEIMLREHFHQNDGVQVQDFLFSRKKEIAKDFVAEEIVELPAGTIKAKHYRKSHDGQIVDFWISSQVMPIGLVKLVSKSTKKKTNNYKIELSSLLKNVKPAIDPSKAIPMTGKTLEMLSSAKAK